MKCCKYKLFLINCNHSHGNNTIAMFVRTIFKYKNVTFKFTTVLIFDYTYMSIWKVVSFGQIVSFIFK